MRKKTFNRFCFAFVVCGLLAGLILPSSSFAGDIAVYGDSQHDKAAHRKIVQRIASFKPSAVFRVGDIVNDGNDPDLWKQFKDISKPLLSTTVYYPALGNHERNSPLYFDTFRSLNGRRWYSVDRDGIHFIVLDSNSSLRQESEQYNWLASDLRSVKEDIKYKIALFHHPLFGVGEGHVADEKGLKPVLLPLFREYGVSAVFSGHEHSYQRYEYDGIYFIVTGGGGSVLRPQIRNSPYLKKFKKVYHFCLLSPETDGLRVRVIDIDSNVIDDFKISPSLREQEAANIGDHAI